MKNIHCAVCSESTQIRCEDNKVTVRIVNDEAGAGREAFLIFRKWSRDYVFDIDFCPFCGLPLTLKGLEAQRMREV